VAKLIQQQGDFQAAREARRHGTGASTAQPAAAP
jgi:hypothetical protein